MCAGDNDDWLVRDIQKLEKNYREKMAKGMVISLLEKGQDGKLYVVPLIMYGEGKYQSVYFENWNKDVKRISSARQSLEGMRNFALYIKGNAIGKFEVIGFKDSSQEGGPQVALASEIRWQSKPTTDIDTITNNAMALSRPIP